MQFFCRLTLTHTLFGKTAVRTNISPQTTPPTSRSDVVLACYLRAKLLRPNRGVAVKGVYGSDCRTSFLRVYGAVRTPHRPVGTTFYLLKQLSSERENAEGERARSERGVERERERERGGEVISSSFFLCLLSSL